MRKFFHKNILTRPQKTFQKNLWKKSQKYFNGQIIFV
jgi:hypothetical protein